MPRPDLGGDDQRFYNGTYPRRGLGLCCVEPRKHVIMGRRCRDRPRVVFYRCYISGRNPLTVVCFPCLRRFYDDCGRNQPTYYCYHGRSRCYSAYARDR